MLGGAQGTGKLGNILNLASQGLSNIPQGQGGGNPQGGGIGPSNIPSIQAPSVGGAVPRPNMMDAINRGRKMANPSYAY